MQKPSTTKNLYSDNGPYADLCRLWGLRLYHSGIAKGYEVKELIQRQFGEEADPEKIDQFKKVIADKLKLAEESQPALDGVLAENLALLSKHFGLNKIECKVLAFYIIYRINQVFTKTLDNGISEQWTDQLAIEVISTSLKYPCVQIEKVINPQGRLSKSGLLSCNVNIKENFKEKITVMSGIVSVLIRPVTSINDLLSFAFIPLATVKQNLENYPHHRQDIELIQSHLRESIKWRTKGVNILLHGSDDVGKTKFASAIIANLGLNAFKVSQLDQTEDNHHRLRAYTILQRFLCKTRKGLILFDEIENVLPQFYCRMKSSNPDQAHINNALEENLVPTIWIANDLSQVDPTCINKFDIVLEVRTPPRSVRKAILTEKMKGLPISKQWLERISCNAAVTPAMADRIVNVIRSSKVADTVLIEHDFDRLVEEHQNAREERTLPGYPIPNDYHLDWLNTSTDMTALCQGIRRSNKGRILLYGPPGCGKTAFAHHLAKITDRPLILKRASDIISAYVGETEKNLRNIFCEAKDDNSILLLDEADSFLQDRRVAVRSWELTQVNELLTQMENFQAIFICATNFIEHLDTAAIRRFAFKVKFDYLTKMQAEAMFNETLLSLKSELPNAFNWRRIQQRLMGMDKLTPGDFTAIAEQFNLLGKQANAEELLAEVSQSCEIKEGGRNFRIGFSA